MRHDTKPSLEEGPGPGLCHTVSRSEVDRHPLTADRLCRADPHPEVCGIPPCRCSGSLAASWPSLGRSPDGPPFASAAELCPVVVAEGPDFTLAESQKWTPGNAWPGRGACSPEPGARSLQPHSSLVKGLAPFGLPPGHGPQVSAPSL